MSGCVWWAGQQCFTYGAQAQTTASNLVVHGFQFGGQVQRYTSGALEPYLGEGPAEVAGHTLVTVLLACAVSFLLGRLSTVGVSCPRRGWFPGFDVGAYYQRR